VRFEELATLPARDFERLVGEAFRRQGYEVRDLGPDFGLERDGEVFLLRCIHARHVRAAPVRDFDAVLSRTSASGGFLVASGRFSVGAAAIVQDTHLQLVDGHELSALIRHAQARPAAGA
jgi:restriction system protein